MCALTVFQQKYARVILLTSLFWMLVDVFIIYYLAGDCKVVRESCDPGLLLGQKSNYIGDDELPREKILNKLKDVDKEMRQGNKRLYEVNKSIDLLKITSPNIQKFFREDNSQLPTNPPDWPGENGMPVIVPESRKREAEERFKENYFNIVASETIALNRSIPDQRLTSCRNREYPVDLPTTSIIIVYHNEGNSTLLRGLVSIIRKSPNQYLKEIILVDDASEDRDYLHGPLDDFVKTLPVRVRIFRNTERLGLMRSRLVGADAATGDTLTFLDAHIEATDGWLPPLLNEIKQNR